VIFGLLMLSAIAPTSIAEERQRGSLDILAATTLSTRAIVIGKWLGTFRLVLLMVIGPGLVAFAMATARAGPARFARPSVTHPDVERVLSLGGRCYGVFVVIATILAHGALITSIGLGLAVWIKRQSRAIAASVGEALSSVLFWDVLLALLAVGLSGWTNWVERSRLIGIAKPSLATDLDDAQPGVETAFVVESAHH
jgi:ABC-type Na+ efflux pump permease subunit